MKTFGNLFPEIVSFGNLMAAARLAAKGRRMLPAPGKFLTRIETGVLRLREELLAGTWRPGPYKSWFIHEPKTRMISAAPFRDRVVHHAVCRVVMPLFDRRMIYDLWSNRPGKGTHGAVDRA